MDKVDLAMKFRIFHGCRKCDILMFGKGKHLSRTYMNFNGY